MGDQHTSDNQGVGDSVSRQIGQMATDATRKYPGGTEKAKLAKECSNFESEFHAFLDRLATEQTAHLTTLEYSVWKTLRIGTGLRSVKDFIDAIHQAGGKVSDWTKSIMEKMAKKRAFAVARRLTELELIRVTPAKLGLPQGAPTEEIYDRAILLGLSLCSLEVGLQLRLQYMDQPEGECLIVAIERITGTGNDQRVFMVTRDAYGRCLYTSYLHPGNNVWASNSQWIFCRKKKA